MASTFADEKRMPPLWEYVSVADYCPPAAPVQHAVKKRLADLFSKFRSAETASDSPLKSADELRPLPQGQLERIAPASDWHEAAEALEFELKDWLRQERPGCPVVVLVGAPYSGHAGILTQWAERQAWPVVSPPSVEQVLAGDAAWLSGQIGDSSPWVFPVLERAYLRHGAGLSLIRRFLEDAYCGKLGRGIIGCDSWAWAFLCHVWQGRFPITLALQAFDQARLSRYLQSLIVSSHAGQLLFRQADRGDYVLPPPDAGEESRAGSNFLQILAAHSRGVIGIGLAGWRASLRTEPDAMRVADCAAESGNTPKQTLWITPWNQLKHPSLWVNAGRDEAIVLHTLLLHNGLPSGLLWQLLPLSANQVTETLFRLEAANLIEQQGIVWRVTPLGYPAVRQFLRDKDYLIDQF